MSDSSSILVRGTLYIVFCSSIVKNTHWTKGWKCLWRGHSVNQNRPLLSHTPPLRVASHTLCGSCWCRHRGRPVFLFFFKPTHRPKENLSALRKCGGQWTRPWMPKEFSPHHMPQNHPFDLPMILRCIWWDPPPAGPLCASPPLSPLTSSPPPRPLSRSLRPLFFFVLVLGGIHYPRSPLPPRVGWGLGLSQELFFPFYY